MPEPGHTPSLQCMARYDMKSLMVYFVSTWCLEHNNYAKLVDIHETPAQLYCRCLEIPLGLCTIGLGNMDLSA